MQSKEEKVKKYLKHTAIFLLISLLLATFSVACKRETAVTETEQVTATEAEATGEENAGEEASTAESGVSNLELLPPEPQIIEFNSADGYPLTGRYFPAAVNPAPLVVLMHWALGDQEDWAEIAYWLQNRGLSGKSPKDAPWLDPSWFPPLGINKTYAVFTFTFRNCEGGCKGFPRELWLQDATAAMRTAYGLEGIDKNLITAIGASIGADGAADG